MTAGAALCFLHLFSGSRDRLGEALTNEAKAAGFDLIVEAYDICKGDDLTNPSLVREILTKASSCWVPVHHLHQTTLETGRGPARTRALEAARLPQNSRAQQDEADRGTLLAITSVQILEAVEASCAVDGMQRTVTFENPPETCHPQAGSAFYLPEIVRWLNREGIEYADFNNCIYANPAIGEQPYRKPQRFVGKLPGLTSLSGRCRCGEGFEHPKIVGTAAKDSAGYPVALCSYAKPLRWSQPGGRKRTVEPPTIEERSHGGSGLIWEPQGAGHQEGKEGPGGMRRPVWALEHIQGSGLWAAW